MELVHDIYGKSFSCRVLPVSFYMSQGLIINAPDTTLETCQSVYISSFFINTCL